MSETKLATVRFGIRPDVIDDTEIQNLIESYHREYISFIENGSKVDQLLTKIGPKADQNSKRARQKMD